MQRTVLPLPYATMTTKNKQKTKGACMAFPHRNNEERSTHNKTSPSRVGKNGD